MYVCMYECMYVTFSKVYSRIFDFASMVVSAAANLTAVVFRSSSCEPHCSETCRIKPVFPVSSREPVGDEPGKALRQSLICTEP